MKTITRFVFVVCMLPFQAHAFNVHNGITFDMTQKEVENKGFVCNPPEEKDPNVKARCEHMDMTGVAFGYPTKEALNNE